MAERDTLACGTAGWQVTSQVIFLLLPPHCMANRSSYSLLKSREKNLGKFREQPNWGTRSSSSELLQAQLLPLLVRGTEEAGVVGKGCVIHASTTCSRWSGSGSQPWT